MLKRFIIHYDDNIFGDILTNYNQIKLIINFLKISYSLS